MLFAVDDKGDRIRPFMTNEQILKKAIEKVVENGWDMVVNGRRYAIDASFMHWDVVYIIFSHSFAKAFFGVNFKRHLQIMVVKEQPLKYIEQFLNAKAR